MHKHGFLVGLSVFVFAAPAYSQLASEADTLKQVSALVEGLKVRSPGALQKSYFQLTAYRPLPKEIAPVLAKIIAAETGDVRTVAAIFLVEITPKDASLAGPLADGLASKDSDIAAGAMEGLEQLGPLAKPALPKVLAALVHPDGRMQEAGIRVLPNMGKDAIAPLEKIILKTVGMGGRHDAAAAALGKIGPDATPAILNLLDMDDPAVDYHAAVAFKSMDKKPLEALKPMLRLAQHKDGDIRLSAVEYLLDVTPPTDAINAVLWEGMDDKETFVAMRCRNVMRERTTDKMKWGNALRKTLQSPRRFGGLAVLYEYHQIDPQQAAPFVLAAVHRVLGAQPPQKWQFVLLATLDKDLVRHLPDVYKYLDGNTTRFGSTFDSPSRLNAIKLLTLLDPKYTDPVSSQLRGDLKSMRWELKLLAAQAILRTNPPEKTRLAKAMAETFVTSNLSDDFPCDQVLADLRALGEPAVTIPSLRIAQHSAQEDVKAKILLTMAALDAEYKPTVLAIAQKMQKDVKSSFAGTAVLLELGAIKTDDAMQTLAKGLYGDVTQHRAMRAIEIVGPKAKPLAPKLEAMLANPRNRQPIPIVLALDKIDGDHKTALVRLLRIARDDPRQLQNVVLACARFGPKAQPIVPELLQLAAKQRPTTVLREAISRIDPASLVTIAD